MGILSNFIGSAASAGGEIMQRQREADVDLAKQKSYADYASELELKKQTALEILREERDIRTEGRTDARTIAGEKRGMENRRIEREDAHKELVTRAPELRDIKVEDAKAAKRAEYDPEIQALMRKAETERLTAAEQAKLDHFTKNRASILGQIRDTARAGHIDDGAGLRAVQIEAAKQQVEAGKLSLAEKQKANALIEEFTTTKDPVRKAEITQALTVRGIIKPGEFDTEKVTTETMNPDGSTSKIERTQKRNAGQGGDAATKAGKNGWDSTTGQVFRNGEVVGTAKSEQEARALVKGGAPAKDAGASKPATDKPRGILESVRPDPPKPPTTLETMEKEKANELRPMVDALKVAEQQFVATARSGDQQAIQRQMAAKEKIRADLERAASAKFGNKAPEVLRQLGI